MYLYVRKLCFTSRHNHKMTSLLLLVSDSLRKVFGLRQEQPIGRASHLAAEGDDGMGARKRTSKKVFFCLV